MSTVSPTAPKRKRRTWSVTDHEHHELVLNWFATHAATGGWATCAVTELGLARRNGGQLVTFDRQLAADGGHDVVCLLPEPV